MFRTLVFHEIRPVEELYEQPRPILVADGYEDALPLPLFDSLPLFQEQINYLKQEGFHSLSISEVRAFYEQGQPLPEKSVLLTFDDCYQSLKEYAYPVLKEAGFQATVFVAAGWLFQTPSCYQPEVSKVLSKEELKEMADVFEYANHTTHFHERRGTIQSRPMWETAEHFKEDLLLCNEQVALTDVFAYPFGLYDQQTVHVLREMNFCLAFTTKSGINTYETAPLELHREVIPYTMPIEAFKTMMETEGK
ncbi:polysaccharide deacetylase family protein [uncultured Enterococcus sp.]|uniref:polysaccharide deacetylase family protein n=1 Tax=uncultured Enterococcus sp. TaxID=167972 RepID=UPI002AA8C8A4|nr:polysaccharide deacetylase family protein [uncultured Enterococcus sp.]